MPMSLPAVASPDPIAVLVLAWDEATPAVRALVEATEASAPPLDSLLVLVPQPAAPTGLSAEEYLPLPADLPVLAAAEAEAEEILPTAGAAVAPAEAPKTPESPLPAEATVPAEFSAAPPEASAPPRPAPGAAITASLPAPPIWAAVRILRLGSLNPPPNQPGQLLPAPVWAGAVVAPAAPYLGASTPAVELAPSALGQTAVPAEAALAPTPGLGVVLASLSATPATTAAEPLPAADAARPAGEAPAVVPTYIPAESAAQAPDLETDQALAETAELLDAEASEEALPPADEFLLDTENTAGPVAPDAPPLAASQAEAFVAELPESPSAVSASPAHPALRPADQHYPAPDLNYQIIQYARLAVPLALAEPEFAAIYAPAWPTWLAAQELRQRTGQPLVLHVAALAAADNETIDTAAGWVAELQRQALRRADLILAETSILAQRLRRELGLHYGMVLTVPAAEAEAVAQALRTAQPKPGA